MSAILEAALALKAAREDEARALEEMTKLGTLPPPEITVEKIDAAMHATNEAIAARVNAEREYLRLTSPSEGQNNAG
jgi:hypothetical protein